MMMMPTGKQKLSLRAECRAYELNIEPTGQETA